jgi:hypothetical protein
MTFKLSRVSKKLAAYSLMEVVVSLAIIGIVISMLTNVLVTSLIVSQKSLARSFVREEVANIAGSIVSDIRNASQVVSCSGSLTSARCELVLDQTYTWELCTTGETSQVCKRNSAGEIIFASSGSVHIDQFSFENGFDVESNTVRKNVLVTVIASHDREFFNVHNIVQQFSVSTRNYLLL